jgi:hypothetical protein
MTWWMNFRTILVGLTQSVKLPMQDGRHEGVAESKLAARGRSGRGEFTVKDRKEINRVRKAEKGAGNSEGQPEARRDQTKKMAVIH